MAAMAIPKKGVIPPFQDPSCVVCGNGEILVQGKRDRIEIIKCEIDIHKLPPLQYGITYDSGYTSMREVRLMRRRPELYKKLIE